MNAFILSGSNQILFNGSNQNVWKRIVFCSRIWSARVEILWFLWWKLEAPTHERVNFQRVWSKLVKASFCLSTTKTESATTRTRPFWSGLSAKQNNTLTSTRLIKTFWHLLIPNKNMWKTATKRTRSFLAGLINACWNNLGFCLKNLNRQQNERVHS